MTKKLLILLLFPIVSYAQVDYSINDGTNPYLIDNNTSNNVNSIKSNRTYVTYNDNPVLLGNKYKHLIANAESISGCWDKAALTYHVDPWLLVAIANVESNFKNGVLNQNRNKCTDIGMMQINSIWLPTLKKFNISKSDLYNPCTSIFVGAWIVAKNIQTFGYNIDGVGAYNSPSNIKIRRAYGHKVFQSYKELINDFKPRNVEH